MRNPLVIIVSVLSLITAQTTENLDDLIFQVFTSPTNTTPKMVIQGGLGGGFTDTNEEEQQCECVPFYLCNSNNTVITDGSGVINARINECSPTFVCCNPPNIVNQPNEPTRAPGRTPPTIPTTRPTIPPIRPTPTVPTVPDPFTPMTARIIPTIPTVANIPDPFTPKTTTSSKSCGVHNPLGIGSSTAVSSNYEANFGEFPWMVAIYREVPMIGAKYTPLVYQCGGSLIHPQAVLTAAHCINRNTKYFARAGESVLHAQNEHLPSQEKQVAEIIIHPQYVFKGYYNDIAILILESPVTIAENVNTICLLNQGEIVENTRCYITGWNVNAASPYNTYKTHRVVLKKYDVPIVPRSKCQQHLRYCLSPMFHLHQSFVCAGGEMGRSWSKGDGGSPLVCPIPNNPGKFYQVGIGSDGVYCGYDQHLGVYASIGNLRKWIDQQLQAYNLITSYYSY